MPPSDARSAHSHAVHHDPLLHAAAASPVRGTRAAGAARRRERRRERERARSPFPDDPLFGPCPRAAVAEHVTLAGREDWRLKAGGPDASRITVESLLECADKHADSPHWPGCPRPFVTAHQLRVMEYVRAAQRAVWAEFHGVDLRRGGRARAKAPRAGRAAAARCW
jgi:hypothetical protein